MRQGKIVQVGVLEKSGFVCGASQCLCWYRCSVFLVKLQDGGEVVQDVVKLKLGKEEKRKLER